MVLSDRNLRKTCLSILLGAVCLAAGLLFLYMNTKAASAVKMGTVDDDWVYFRQGPGTEYSIIRKIYQGETGEILDEKPAASNGHIWYQMKMSDGTIGWSASSYIKLSLKLKEIDQEFEEYLIAQGFPETYRMQLQVLHYLYPNWKFEAQHTGLTWQEVIAAESKVGKSLVQSSAPTSWKSTLPGAYNWETGQWVVFDSGGWVSASAEIVSHFMDPRNFLDEKSIFQFLKQSYDVTQYDTNQIAEIKKGLEAMVEGTFLTGMCDDKPYVDVLMDVGAKKGVSPYVLASMIIQEIGTKGTSGSISGKEPGYEGYYNYYNVGAYKTATLTAVQKGLDYAKSGTSYERPWNTRYKSISGGAELYAKNYVYKGQDTMYLKKFNVQGNNLYSHQYMTNVQGAYSEGIIMSRAYGTNARKGSLEFKIPVYLNMPEELCPKPTGDGNPNYMLKSLAIEGYDLTPTFQLYQQEYSLIVDNEVTKIKILASAFVDSTVITGTGEKSLQVGVNEFTVTSSAQNGGQRTYKLTVIRQAEEIPEDPDDPDDPNNGGTEEPDVPVIPMPNLQSGSYQLNENGTITGLDTYQKSITVNDFINKLVVTDGVIKITTASGTDKQGTSKVGTGDMVKVFDNAGVLQLTYTVVIYGDTNGDGAVNAMDLLRIQKDILLLNKLSGIYSMAADTSKDGFINGLDLLQVQKHILKMKGIQQ